MGRCQTLDAAGAGYGRGEGIAMLRLDGYVVDEESGSREGKHNPLALIRGSNVNQDGRSSSLTSPSGPSQTALLETCFIRGSVSPSCTQAVSMHGTGTQLGDPIEVNALGACLMPKERSGFAVQLTSSKVWTYIK